MRLFTCGQAHNEACKCTADQNLNVAKVKTNLGEGGVREGCTCPVCGQTHPATARYNRVKQIGKNERQKEFIASQNSRGGGKLSHAASKVF